MCAELMNLAARLFPRIVKFVCWVGFVFANAPLERLAIHPNFIGEQGHDYSLSSGHCGIDNVDEQDDQQVIRFEWL